MVNRQSETTCYKLKPVIIYHSQLTMIHILGIRHHGPGSAKNVKEFLETVKPDIVLVEGPPEADPLLQWVNHAELKPPVAILVYQPDDPQYSSFYLFAEFSSEWQAISYARKNNIHVRFMDLPIGHHIALDKEAIERVKKEDEERKTPEGARVPKMNSR